MDFNVMDYLAYHADVAVPAIILMVIVSAIYLIFYGIRPIKTRFLILFLLSIVSLIIFVLDNPLYYYLGSPFSGLLFVFLLPDGLFSVLCTILTNSFYKESSTFNTLSNQLFNLISD